MKSQTKVFLVIAAFLTQVWLPGFSQEVIDSLVGYQIRFASNINQEPLAEPLDHRVNTPFREFKPLISPDGKILYFSRQHDPKNVGGVDDPEDIWFCEFDEESQRWDEAINIGPPLNTEGPNFVSGVGKSGDTLLLGNVYTGKGRLRAGVSLSVNASGTWSPPQQIHLEGDYNIAPRSSYDVSSDRQAILIAEEKDDSHGGMDIYVAFRQPDKKFMYSGSEAVNLGPIVNSYKDETSPFLADDMKTLYFSSNGHYGLGGMDVFVTKRLDDTWQNWSEPENLGPAVNTELDDLFFNFSPYSKYAYYSRGITESNTDIYRVDLTRLFRQLEVKMLKRGKLVIPVMIGQTIRVRNAFDQEVTNLNREAKTDLKELSAFLQDHPGVEILVITHSEKHVLRQESLDLAEKRALEVKNYLELNGIDERRLHSDPKGHDIVVNTTVPYERQYLHNMIEIRFIKM